MYQSAVKWLCTFHRLDPAKLVTIYLFIYKINYFPDVILTVSVKYIVPCKGAQVVWRHYQLRDVIVARHLWAKVRILYLK